ANARGPAAALSRQARTCHHAGRKGRHDRSDFSKKLKRLAAVPGVVIGTATRPASACSAVVPGVSKTRPDSRIAPSSRRKQEVDMLTSTKSGTPEKDRNATVSAAEVIGRVVQHDQTWAKSEPTTKTGMASCIGSDMSIVGNIECKGPAQVFGRIEGEVRASDLQIMAHRSRAASLRRT